MLVEIDNRSLKSEHKRVGQCNSKKNNVKEKKRADIKSWYNVVSPEDKCHLNEAKSWNTSELYGDGYQLI